MSEPIEPRPPDESVDDYRRRARAWLTENLPPRRGAARPRRVEEYTPAVMDASRARQRLLFDAGYTGIAWPRAYGGQGLPPSYERAFADEAMAYELPDFGTLGITTFSICVPTMLQHASPAYLARFVPEVLAGEALVCQFFSEPSSGSDLAGVRMSATPDGERWILNGQKIWSSFANRADWGMCLARTDWDAPKHRGLTWFAVPCDAPGLTIRPITQINESAEFCEEFFDDVAIPDSGRIGDVNDGWTVAQTMLALERSAGRGDEALFDTDPGPIAPDLVLLARRRQRMNDSVVRQLLARAHAADYVGRVLSARVTELGRRGRLHPAEASYAKLFRGTYRPIRARIAVEIGGAAAMTWDTNDADGASTSIEYLNGRTASIAGGTNEMQRNAIAERVLGMPREPSVDAGRPFRDVVRDASSFDRRDTPS